MCKTHHELIHDEFLKFILNIDSNNQYIRHISPFFFLILVPTDKYIKICYNLSPTLDFFLKKS